MLKTPDAALGLVSNAVTLALATAGGADRHRDRPWLPVVLAAKAITDAAGGLDLTVEQATKHRRFCAWCLAATAATAASVAMVPPTLFEARAAVAHLRSR